MEEHCPPDHEELKELLVNSITQLHRMSLVRMNHISGEERMRYKVS